MSAPGDRTAARALAGFLGFGLVATAVLAQQQPPAADRLQVFEAEVRPLLSEHCWRCHGRQVQKSGLRLDHGSFLRAGGTRGPALEAGDPAHSLLLRAVHYQDVDLQMPPRSRLAPAQVAVLERWIADGAFWPDEPVPAAAAPAPGFDFEQRRRHWAWQALCDPPSPPVRDATWVRDPLDAFVLAGLEAAELAPAPPASPAGLLRRVCFDLVGLPPAPALVTAFSADPSEQRYRAIVDDLLASPRFGERWARHWLDLVRYAETLGHEYDFEVPNAWRYRDYVIRALAADVPYDQFVREHLAGDLLPVPRRDPVTGANESVQGTAFWWFVEQTHSPVDVVQAQADRVANQIDVLGKTFLGLTVACARCHDHKFDAITTVDYYALYGIVAGARYAQQPLQPCDLQGEGYRAVLLLQRRLATAVATAAAAADSADPRWRQLALLPPERWDERLGSAAVPALRPGDTLIADAGDAAGWQLSDDGFGSAPWRGPVADDLPAQLQWRLLPGPWWHSGVAGTHRHGLLTTRSFVLDRPFVHVRVAGSGARATLVVEGFQLVRDPIYGGLHRSIGGGDARWVTYEVGRWQGRSAYLQFVDQDTADLADEAEDDRHDRGWVAAQQVLSSAVREPPPATTAVLPPLPFAAAALPAAVQQALTELAAAAARLPLSPTVPALAEGNGSDGHVFVRGNPQLPGELAPRRFLQALAGARAPAIAGGSGRRELADALLAADNPLPARVQVNRILHHLLGRGIVRTVDNFGALGERPTHKALLDRLATDFVRSGWSQKQMIRRVVLSSTYRMQSLAAAAARERDPRNDLFSRQSLRRLEGEAIRDALLALSGRLDQATFGPSVPVPLAESCNARGRPAQSGPLDGAGRRSIYLAVRRNFLPAFLLAFDTPAPFATVGARNSSNVPAQALALWNDPFVRQQCQRWAERELASGPATRAQRIGAMFTAAFAHPPTPQQQEQCERFVDDAAQSHGGDGSDLRAWTELAQVLVNQKEFIFLP
ncbi:MAG TPA: PSD1 and planctomycete cytochrome C domain-containing protein [Planctomycetota bacterium]|nr:PSD1 and planctomycete cytochrome C domain-containing protein [Planctomycetota bacterium]